MDMNYNEQVVYRCKLHWGIFLAPVFSALGFMIPVLAYTWLMSDFMEKMSPLGVQIHFPWLLLLLPGLAVGTILFLAVLVAYIKSEVVLTESRLRFKVGWLSLGSTEILLTKIETITLWEPLVGRLFGYGTVSVTGTGGAVFRLRYLPKPEYFHSLLQSIMNGGAPASRSQGVKESLKNLEEMHARYMPKG